MYFTTRTALVKGGASSTWRGLALDTRARDLSDGDLLAFAEAARQRIGALVALVASAPARAADIELAVEALQLAIAELVYENDEAEEPHPKSR